MERKHHRYTLPSGTSKSQTKNYRPSENDHVQKGPENDNTVTFVTKHFPVKLLINTNKKNSLWFSFINSFWWDIFSLRFSSIITRYVTTSSKYLLISALETVHSSETGTTPATIRLVTPQRETQSCVISFVWKLFECRFYSI